MKKIPDKIYLQVFGDGDPTDDVSDIDLNDVTWCKDRIYDGDVEYRRVYDRKDYPKHEEYKYHADRIMQVLVATDKTSDNSCNTIQVVFKHNNELKDTNAPNLIFDKDTRARLRKLLLSAVDYLTNIDD